MASPSSALTVTADDFGIGPETSRGIVDAFLAGAISRASVMTGTGDRVDRSLETLARAPKLPLGLHLTLTGDASTPLVAKRSSGLVTRDGRFHSLPQLAFRCALRRVDDVAIEDEILAQTERFRALLGKAPTHVDGHHHAHQLPVISRVLSEIVSRNELPRRIRNTLEPRELRAVPGARTRRAVIHGLGHRSRVEFQSVRALVPDGFFGVLSPEMLAHAKDPSDNPWAPYLAALPQTGNFEMMVHPGHPDPELAGRDGYIAKRQLELAALLALGPKIFARP
jgi:predicted glycoside hydrolase/deacetylase ChbG (UPF0249 family)